MSALLNCSMPRLLYKNIWFYIAIKKIYILCVGEGIKAAQNEKKALVVVMVRCDYGFSPSDRQRTS